MLWNIVCLQKVPGHCPGRAEGHLQYRWLNRLLKHGVMHPGVMKRDASEIHPITAIQSNAREGEGNPASFSPPRMLSLLVYLAERAKRNSIVGIPAPLSIERLRHQQSG